MDSNKQNKSKRTRVWNKKDRLRVTFDLLFPGTYEMGETKNSATGEMTKSKMTVWTDGGEGQRTGLRLVFTMSSRRNATSITKVVENIDLIGSTARAGVGPWSINVVHDAPPASMPTLNENKCKERKENSTLARQGKPILVALGKDNQADIDVAVAELVRQGHAKEDNFYEWCMGGIELYKDRKRWPMPQRCPYCGGEIVLSAFKKTRDGTELSEMPIWVIVDGDDASERRVHCDCAAIDRMAQFVYDLKSTATVENIEVGEEGVEEE